MSSIEAWAALAKSEPLEPFVYPAPEFPPPGEVSVRVTHCGVCHSDVHQIDDDWKIATFPLVPGHEVVGFVEALGEGVDSFHVGDRVGIGPQRGSCGDCVSCSAGAESVCKGILKTYGGKGNHRGGFARKMHFPARWCFAIPDELPSEMAAPLMCAGITTFSPLKVHATAGARVGVAGVGGLGHLALQTARAMGYHTLALTSSPGKVAQALELGAHTCILASDEAALHEAQGTLDLLLCTSSGAMEWDALLDLLKPGGKLCLVGLPPKAARMSLLAQSLVKQEKALVGSYLGPRSLYPEMLRFAAEHGVRPLVEVVPVSQANVAVERVRSNQARYRMVLSME